MFLFVAGGAFAQLSTGEPHANVIPRTGNRPQAGDFGLYIGASVTQVMDLVKLNKKQFIDDIDGASGMGKSAFWALPAINLKYYMTDDWEFRMGFQFASKGTTRAVKYDKSKSSVDSETYARDVHYTRFLPGFAYHFNTNNILDVYLGAQIPIGFDIDNTRDNYKKDGKKYNTTRGNNAFIIGGGVFFGLQVFIADLPFAIGLETGYSGKATIGPGEITKTDFDGTKQTTITGGKGDVKSSAYMTGTWGADATLTFSYYFHR